MGCNSSSLPPPVVSTTTWMTFEGGDEKDGGVWATEAEKIAGTTPPLFLAKTLATALDAWSGGGQDLGSQFRQCGIFSPAAEGEQTAKALIRLGKRTGFERYPILDGTTEQTLGDLKEGGPGPGGWIYTAAPGITLVASIGRTSTVRL